MLDALRNSSMLHEHYNIDAIEPSHAASITAMRSQASAVGNFEHPGSLRRVNQQREHLPKLGARNLRVCLFVSFVLRTV
jgi:hypothetical protein